MVFESRSKGVIPWLIACALAMPLLAAAQSTIATPAGLDIGADVAGETYTQDELDGLDPYRHEFDDAGPRLDRRYGYDGREMRREAPIEGDRAFEPFGPRVESPELRDDAMGRGHRLLEGSNVGGGEYGGGYAGGERMGGGYTGGDDFGTGYVGGQPMGSGHIGGGYR